MRDFLISFGGVAGLGLIAFAVYILVMMIMDWGE